MSIVRDFGHGYFGVEASGISIDSETLARGRRAFAAALDNPHYEELVFSQEPVTVTVATPRQPAARQVRSGLIEHVMPVRGRSR